jgi:molybdenum cofactor cytidylyltransferase
MSSKVAAILLAAGKSTRMGSCKQLLPLGGSTVIAHCIEALVAGGAGKIVVVVSEAGHEVAEAVLDYPVRVAVNHAPEGDMSSSVRTGRDALTGEVSGVIVHLCDYPLVATSTIAHLIQEHENSPGSIVIPCNRQRRGHPLLFPRAILDELGDNKILRDLVRRDAHRVVCTEVEDPGVLLDMDTPEDYRRICSLSEYRRGAEPGTFRS